MAEGLATPSGRIILKNVICSGDDGDASFWESSLGVPARVFSGKLAFRLGIATAKTRACVACQQRGRGRRKVCLARLATYSSAVRNERHGRPEVSASYFPHNCRATVMVSPGQCCMRREGIVLRSRALAVFTA